MEDPVFSSVEEEVVYLRAQLAKERTARFKLDEELDLLAFDNDRLRNLVRSIPKAPPAAKMMEASGSTAVAPPSAAGASNNLDSCQEEFLVEGNGKYADTVVTRIDNACGGMNALCVAFCPYPSVTGVGPLVNQEASWAVACGGVDKTFRVYQVPLLVAGNDPTAAATTANAANTLMVSHLLSAPILAMDVCGPLVACALMDGGHAVVSGCDNGCVCVCGVI